jgi:hypothetical protein
VARRAGALQAALLGLLVGCEPRILVGTDCERCDLGQTCHPGLLLCVGCMADADCAQRYGRTRCDLWSFECVECTQASQCGAATPVCLEGACRPCEVEPGACEGGAPVIDAAMDAGAAGEDAPTEEPPSDDETRPRSSNGRRRGGRSR